MALGNKVWQDAVTNVTTDRRYELGTLRSVGNKMYKYVTVDTTTTAVGDVVSYLKLTGYANSDVSVTASACDGVGAGVCVSVIANNEFGWVQIRGAATCSTAFSGSPADGCALTTTGAGNKTMDKAIASEFICAAAMDESAKTIICDFPF